MSAILAAFLLLLGSAALQSQSAILTSELEPFSINRVVVTDLPELENTRVAIIGRSLFGEEVPLFIAGDGALPRELECFLYFDDSIQSVRVEVRSAAAVEVALDHTVTHNPYRVTVFPGPGKMLPLLPGYRTIAAVEQLQAGDILVLEHLSDLGIQNGSVGELLERGIHVITTREMLGLEQQPASEEADPLRASLLLLDSMDQALLIKTLETQREDFAGFKKRYYDLIAGSSFYGIPVTVNRSLNFEDTKVEDIAAFLEQRYLLDRVTPFYRLVLLCFYLPALVLLVVLKRPTPRLLLLALLLAGFVGLSCFAPVADKSLRLQLNPAHLEAPTIELVRTATDEQPAATISRVLSPSVRAPQFAPADFDPAAWRLTYGVMRSNRKEVPLGSFSDPSSLKFNQLPTIEWRTDGYTVRYVNPLRYWSLHEPD